MACGRVPERIAADQRRKRALDTGLDILHLGWARPQERAARHARYVELDGGQFHASEHLNSILWTDEQVTVGSYPACPLS